MTPEEQKLLNDLAKKVAALEHEKSLQASADIREKVKVKDINTGSATADGGFVRAEIGGREVKLMTTAG